MSGAICLQLVIIKTLVKRWQLLKCRWKCCTAEKGMWAFKSAASQMASRIRRRGAFKGAKVQLKRKERKWKGRKAEWKLARERIGGQPAKVSHDSALMASDKTGVSEWWSSALCKLTTAQVESGSGRKGDKVVLVVK